MATVTSDGGGQNLPVKQEADSHHVSEGEENIQVPETKVVELVLGQLWVLYFYLSHKIKIGTQIVV